MRKTLKLAYQLVNAASTVAWIISLGAGSVVTGAIGWVAGFQSPWQYPVWVGVFLLLTGFSLAIAGRFFPAPQPALSANGGPSLTLLLNHRVTVLNAQADHLHELFKRARDAKNDYEVDAAEQVFQLKPESIIKWELADHPKLFRHFYDDAGFNQGSHGGKRQTDVANFLERRYLRLREVLTELESDLASVRNSG
jgi:hypothetical protein